jgi:hypothetical protein
MLREIKSTQRLPRQLALKVNGVGGSPSILIGGFDATLADNGTGDYTLTFAKPFARDPVVVASCVTATCYAEVAASSATSVQILTKSNANAATDAVFHVIVQGYDAADQT